MGFMCSSARKCHDLLTLCMLVKFSCSSSCLLTFCKINLFENSFQEHYLSVKGFGSRS